MVLIFHLQYLQLSFESLDLEANAQCNGDSVSVYAPGSSTALATACGNTCSPTIVVPSSSATVIFTSDAAVSASGFRLTYSLVQPGTILSYYFVDLYKTTQMK